MNSIVKYILVFGTDLYIVSCFDLTVFHMILFHSHKRSISIGFAVGISFALYLFVFIVLCNICRPVLFGIVEFLFYFLVYSFLIFLCRVDLLYGLGYLFWTRWSKSGRPLVFHLLGCNAFCIVPKFF